MKNTKLFSRLSIALVMMLMLSSMQQSFAAGTAAGTAITNTASVTYNDGTNVKSKNSNTVNMYVGHKVAGAFAPASGSITTYDNVTYYYPVSFTNNGNRATPFTISFNAPTNYTLSLLGDADNSGTFTVGDTAFAIGVDSIAVGATHNLLIKAVVGNLADLNSQPVILTFTSAARVDVANNVVVANPAFATTFTLTSTINKAALTFAVGGVAPSPLIPGALFNYGITIGNTGSVRPYGINTANVPAVGDSVQFTYTVPTNFTFNGASSGSFAITPSGSAKYLYNAGVITITIDTAALTPAASLSFTLPVTIDQTQNNGTGPAPGATAATNPSDFSTLLNNSPDNSVPVTATTSGTVFAGGAVVATSNGGKFTVTPANASAAASEAVEYIFTLKNMGNVASTYTLADVQNGGTFNTDHLIALTSNGTDLATNPTGSVAPGSTIQIYVRVTVPGGAVVTNTIIRDITITPVAAGTLYTGNVANDYNHTVTTTVVAATFSITLAAESIVGSGTTTNPAPGDEITFALTIANTSPTINSTSVVISNLIPANLTFVAAGFAAGSGITIDGVNKTNANDGDDAWFDATGNGTVQTNSTFSVNALATKVLRYKCTVN